MADTMIERVAKALMAATGADGFPILNADPDFHDMPTCDAGTDETNPFTEAEVLALSRAVIAAMRDPTEDMETAAVLAPNYLEDQTSRRGFRIIWRAAIDAALAEEG